MIVIPPGINWKEERCKKGMSLAVFARWGIWEFFLLKKKSVSLVRTLTWPLVVRK